MLPPLAFVVILSMIKDAYEDYKRHKADHEENSATANVYDHDSNCFVTAEWKRVKVGDILRVHENTFFPADLVILSSSEPEGTLYVETKNLDGETNLKLKSIQKDMVEHFVEDSAFAKLTGTINIE